MALLALQHAADELREQGHPLGPIVYVATDKIVDVVERINTEVTAELPT